MALEEWADPEHTLASVMTVFEAPLSQTLPRLSAVVDELLPHRALLLLSGDCVASPLRAHGDPALSGTDARAEMTRLAGAVDLGKPWSGEITVSGARHPVLAVAARPRRSAGSVLALVLDGEPAVAADPRGMVLQRLWELTAAHIAEINAKVEPAFLSEHRAASGERTRTATELTDAHAANLTALLNALRSRELPDALARRTAVDIAANALVELRAASELEQSEHEETLGEAFSQLTDKLLLFTRHSEVDLEFNTPEQADLPLPTEVASAARSTVRSALLTVLEQPGVTRIRVAWEVADGFLLVSLRDDGPGTLTPEALGVHRLSARLGTVEGTLDLDSVPGWGSTLIARVPLGPAQSTDADPLAGLNPREVDVLHQLTLGRRNRQIAQHLHISEHTVKYHVANILDKLGVSSRGEAAAAARGFGLVPTAKNTAS
jgi:DNA-binding CsgD family transcriptional regulator/signal transduction histidine kinase